MKFKKAKSLLSVLFCGVLLSGMAACQKSCRLSGLKRDDLGLVPKEATWIARMDVKRWMEAPTGKYIYDLLERRDFVSQKVQMLMTRLTKDCGIEPIKRIHNVLAAVPVQAPSESQQQTEGYFFVVRGQFSEQEIVSCLAKMQKNEKPPHKSVYGINVYHLDSAVRFTLPQGKDMLLIGSERHLEKILSGTLTDKDTLSAKPALLEEAAKLFAGDDAFWVVGLSSQNNDVKNSVSRLLAKPVDIKLLTVQLSFQKGISITLGARMENQSDAQETAGLLRKKWDQLLESQPRIQQTKLGETLKNVQISSAGSGVTIRILADPIDSNAALDVANALTRGASEGS